MALPEEDPRTRNFNSPTNTWPGNQPAKNIYGAANRPASPAGVLDDPQVKSDRAALGALWEGAKELSSKAGSAIADVATLPARIPVGVYDNTVVRGMRAAGFNATPLSPLMVPAGADPGSFTPFQDLQRQKDQGVQSLAAAAAKPSVAPNPSPAAPGIVNSTDQRLATGEQRAPGGSLPDPQPTANAGVSTAATGNVTRNGNNYSATGPVTGNITINGQEPRNGGVISAQNMAAADSLSQRGLSESLGRVNVQPQGYGLTPAPSLASQGRGFSGSFDTGMSGNLMQRTPEQRRRDAEVQSTSILKPTAARGLSALAALDGQELQALRNTGQVEVAQVNNQGALERTGAQEAGSNFRAGLSAQGMRDANQLRRDEFNREGIAVGFKNSAMEQLQNAKTPEERRAASETLLAMQGRDRQQNEWGLQVTPNTKNADGSTTEGSVYQWNKATREARRVDVPPKAVSTAPLPNHVSALRNDPKLAAQFDAQYGAGAAAKILGEK